MDADAVVYKFLAKYIIDGGDLNRIAQNASPEQKNQILHLALKRRCTDKALMDACDIIIAVKNRKMTALGEAMRRALDASKRMCVLLSFHAAENVLDHSRDQLISVMDGLGDGCMCACALEVGLSCLCSCLHLLISIKFFVLTPVLPHYSLCQVKVIGDCVIILFLSVDCMAVCVWVCADIPNPNETCPPDIRF